MSDNHKIDIVHDDEKLDDNNDNDLTITEQQHERLLPSQPHTYSEPLVTARAISLSPRLKTALPIGAYCIASILMTVTNKYVVSGYGFNMNFLLLTVQVSYYYNHLRVYICGGGEEEEEEGGGFIIIITKNKISCLITKKNTPKNRM
ncbi:hypothetical protein BDA99DRAFT_495658 [Phascolomyces articulosus]|uniref:Uncharacterized protein n=1 Tax=Phascolomyces articulosus TaxID=60185 RepID=A0AAD5PIZ4_9FUNG|nr:hypothetical protein BDA99DRAFT_495658 [Phascolomyces articulosus]